MKLMLESTNGRTGAIIQMNIRVYEVTTLLVEVIQYALGCFLVTFSHKILPIIAR